MLTLCLWLSLFILCFGGLVANRLRDGLPNAHREPTPKERAEFGDAGSRRAFFYWKALPVTIPFVVLFWPMLLVGVVDERWRRRR